ncbi:MAG: hypothetical protein FWD69_03780, partial [Polyangiaceae bacterium]|nr:hypothetical protein [Polyangiaceae bacterium]
AWVWAVVGVGALILGVGAWWKLSKGEKGEGKGQPVASRVEAGSGEEGVIPPPPESEHWVDRRGGGQKEDEFPEVG